ncbi:hypothetical protein HYH02_004064 [Chlamydomonas schloesseri]|uniref:Leucine-rich repeat-containing N-terminal plant-type domain-containing protein n=1 Tax=Chlamydomonas schloesseri TaxID=2026947 RepID=A0A835WPY7_9CHLO|nr:hypothetical protein HYH02_004064 [Chlamydomonas schloesseri]|eukprot:KAG2451466.1 hypothetical protein HYH02_004064 [Chlamydomonas schloesseri]
MQLTFLLTSATEVLVEIRRQLEGAVSASALAAWTAAGSACAWPGVGCDSLGAVTSLDLTSHGLTGTLPGRLTDLEGLQSLILVNNSIGGKLPVEWSSMVDLEVLVLDANAISGSLPAMWAALGSLRELRLRNNRLGAPTGSGLPAAWGGGLGSLQVLDLSDNPHLGEGGLVSGSPDGLSRAPGAQLPSSWGRLAFLRSLLLRNTGLAGTLPPDLVTLRRLVRMDLSSNSISGTLPASWAPGGSAAAGGVAAGLTALRQIDLSGNRLWGTLPVEWSSFASLQYLSVASNALSGTVPEAWGAQRGLAVLKLFSNSALCGPMPGVLQPMLLAGTASGTASGGGNVNSPAQETSALAAAINGTQLLGSCPWSQTGSLLLSLRQAMTGHSSTTLADWVPGTDPCGTATAWEGVLCVDQAVTGLDLSGKGLSGTLPPQLPLLNGLGRLVLDNNSLTGMLPGSWSQLAALSHMSLRRNSLAGGLPAGWGALSALSYMDLSYNGLRGPLPLVWADGLPRIAHIRLDGNSLNGTLPAAWGAGTTGRGAGPAAAGAASTTTTTSIYAGLVTLLSLHADGNSFSGVLPVAWSRLQQLQELSLKDNLLTGPVPWEWADPRGMSSLRYLGLSSNAGMCGPAPTAAPATATPAAASNSSTRGVTSSSTTTTASIPSSANTTRITSSVFRLEADDTQLGAACPPLADSSNGSAMAAGAQLWIAAGAGSVGTLVLVGVIAAAASAVNRRRAAAGGNHSSSPGGATDAAAKHGSIAAAVAAHRRASAGGMVDGSRSAGPAASPRAPAGSPRCASVTSPSGRVGSYGSLSGLAGGVVGPAGSPQSFLVTQRLRSAPSPAAMLQAAAASGAAASAARRLYGGPATHAVASDGEDGGGGGRKARSHALHQQQQYQPRLSHLAPGRAPEAPLPAHRGMEGGGTPPVVAADTHLSPWHTSAIPLGTGSGRAQATADDGAGLQFAPSPTRSVQPPHSPLHTPPHSPRVLPTAASNTSAVPLPSPRPVNDTLPVTQYHPDSFGWLWGGSTGAGGAGAGDATAAADADEQQQARSGLLSMGIAAAMSSFTRIVGGFLPRRSSAGSGMPSRTSQFGGAADVALSTRSPRPNPSASWQPAARGEANGGQDEDMAAAAELYQAMAMADRRGALEAARSGTSTPRGAAAIGPPRLSTNPLFAGPETNPDGTSSGAEQQSDLPTINTASDSDNEQLQQLGTQLQRKLRVSAGLGEDDSDSELQTAEVRAAGGDADGAARMLAAPTFMVRPAEASASDGTASDQGLALGAGAPGHAMQALREAEGLGAAGFGIDSPRLGMPPVTRH